MDGNILVLGFLLILANPSDLVVTYVLRRLKLHWLFFFKAISKQYSQLAKSRYTRLEKKFGFH